ncbi:uncharacterized protein LOC115095801 isoform X6 [Rhinatrema bivittatum]|uniref:uncharacterized protein LOC115095801 isoform X6 n=1 Tax=Rhinatrema bivittatum TaxID=194408 RepID=UPI0011292F2D|nr:uncharacterized protein LOC115095801 isoform X6 [Rhinatrema bivittatum]
MSELDERTEFLDSKFPAGIMEPTNLFKVHNLETPYSAERDHNIPQEEQARNDLTSKGASKRSLEAEDQQLMLEIAASAASVTTYKTLKERHAVEREKLEAAPGGVTQKCCTAAEKPEPLRNGEREADLQDQLTDAMEKAMASERRASELQEVERLRQEIGSLHATRETLRREKNELLLLLSEQKRCLPERGTHWDGEHQKEVTEMPLEASQVPESTALKEAEEEGQNTGNKRAEQLVRLRTEFDFVRDESHAMVEQLTSLQQQLRTLRQGNRKQPSSFLRELLRTSLVAALGILLFWWAADQLG